MACGIIASTSGPSSATLIIPRLILWPVESSYVLINGTDKDLWPDRLDPDQVASNCLNVEPDQTTGESQCPGANWYSLYTIFRGLIGDGSTGWSNLTQTDFLGYYTAPAPGSLQNTNGMFGNCPGDQTSSQICGAVVPQIGAVAAFNNSDDWSITPKVPTSLDVYHSVDKDFYSAITAIRCIPDVISNPSDTSPLRFAQLAQTEHEY